jgi:hypothetical protein
MLFVVEYHGGQITYRSPPSIVRSARGFHESWMKRSVASERHFVKARWPSSA